MKSPSYLATFSLYTSAAVLAAGAVVATAATPARANEATYECFTAHYSYWTGGLRAYPCITGKRPASGTVKILEYGWTFKCRKVGPAGGSAPKSEIAGRGCRKLPA